MDPILGAPPVRQTRRNFLRQSAMVTLAGTAAAGILVPARKVHAADVNSDAVSSYEETQFKLIGRHETKHVEFLLGALGSAARPRPAFQGLEQPTFEDFVAVAQALENTGVGAYLGALPAIFSHEYAAAAGSVALIEARHAGYLNSLESDPVTGWILHLNYSQNFENPLTPEQVDALAGPFINRLNGGPPLTYSNTPSPANDIAILNFALGLEYLEEDFYIINNRKFFS